MKQTNVIQGGIYQYAQETGFSFDEILNGTTKEQQACRSAYYLMLRRAEYTYEQIALICGRFIASIHRSVISAEKSLEKGDPKFIKFYKIAKSIGIKKNEIINPSLMTE